MEKSSAVAALAALAQDNRLDVFRLLVEAGPDGMPAGEVADALGLAPNTLTFHFDRLRAGQGKAEEEGDCLMDKPFNVLFLCTGNSARSIMAEAILNREGRRHFRAYSAGSHPKGQVHPYALDLLRRLSFDVSGLRSKSWHEFSRPGATPLDFVV